MAHGLLYGASFKNGVLSFVDKQGRSLCEVSFPKYLTLTAVEDNSSVALKKVGTVTNTYEYRKNGGAWTAYELTTDGTAISLNTGDKLEWRCTAWKSTFSDTNYVQFVMTGKISASNPVTSMISSTLNHTTISNDYACYSLFEGCTALTKAPELPATTLASYCYYNMFNGCTALNEVRVSATDIPAINCTLDWLSGVSSTGNFYCDPNTSWTSGTSGIPQNWERWVYGAEDTGTTTPMYHNGASETVRVGTSSYGTCYALQGWVGFKLLAGMHALGYTFGTQTIVTLYEDEHRISAYACDANDEDGFTETMYNAGDGDGFLTIAQQNEKRIYTEPTPFTGLVLTATENNSSVKLTNIYTFNKFRVDTGSGWSDYTFGTVINLNAGQSCRWDCPKRPTTHGFFSGSVRFAMTGKIEASGNCLSMLRRNFENESTLDKGAFYRLFEGCTSLTKAPELPYTTLASDCYRNMFNGCTSLTQAPTLPATTLADYCYDSMFEGCTSLTQAPALPATTLASYSYRNMFNGCSALTEVRISATTTATNALDSWLSGVSATGNFYCDPNTSWTSGVSGIPANWRRLNINDYPTT